MAFIYVVIKYIYVAGWEVRMVKNFERGLEKFFRPEVTVFLPYGPTLSRQITCLFFFSALNWFYRVQMGLFTQLLSLNRPVYLRFVKNLGNERVTQIVDKERCIKEQTFFELLSFLSFSCIYFSS